MKRPFPYYDDVGTGSPTLIFLHGLGGSRDYWHPTVDYFSRRHRCVAWTMPGYGFSPPLAEMSFPELADALARLLDQCRIDSAVLVGHSMGGMVAQEMWARHPKRISGLVLVGTTDSFGGGNQEFTDNFLASRLAPIEAGRSPADIADEVINGLVYAPLSEDMLRPAKVSMGAISPRGYSAAVRCLTTFDRRDTLGTISVPTLMLSGADDQTAPPRTMARMADGVRGATHVSLDDCGHLLDLEQPAAFRSAIETFIDQHWRN
ncbi:MAG: 3-oxoadipate enol-lactonase [Candidatus Poriferisodalaceae bacterium]|jgi:3-oxoadipate enol-lactonase